MKRLRRPIQILVTLLYIGIGVAVVGTFVPNGWKLKVVATGSMRPAIPPGSVVVVHPVTPLSIQVGQIVTYNSPTKKGETITHRVIAKNDKQGVPFFITKGDANSTNDPEIVGGQIVGRVLFHVPYVGYLFAGSHTIPGLIALVILPGLLIIIYEWRLMSRRLREMNAPEVKTPDDPLPPSSPPPQHRPRRSFDSVGRRSAAVMVITLVAMAGTTFSVLASNPVTLTDNTIKTVTLPSPTPINCVITSNTNVSVSNNSTQTATSGTASTSGNTNGGTATSGTASNSNSSSTTINITNGASCPQ